MRSIATKTLRIPGLFLLLTGAACSSTPESDGAAGSGPVGGSGNVAGTAPLAGSATAGSPSGGSPGTAGSGTSAGAPSSGAPSGGSPSGGVGGSASGGSSAGSPSGGIGGGAAGSGGSGGTPVDVCPTLPTAPLAASAITQYNDNGGWCWYQDERALVDTKAGKFVIGSVASGGSRDGDIEATVVDIAGTNKKTFTLATNLSVDDHNAPAFSLRPDGKYAAMWAGHRQDCYSYYGVFDGTAWSTTKSFNWAPKGCPWDSAMSQKITYSNLWYLDGKLFSLVRSVQTSPNFLMSGDDGGAFDFYGRLSATPTMGYVAGYYKYWGNNTDRIDFVA
ncbi:MAG TPA: hypothetical protein VEQ58_19040, partial [Polyangiaceae bacterium]|nr:hypothetical protein [Polyangiaceae bacterium]